MDVKWGVNLFIAKHQYRSIFPFLTYWLISKQDDINWQEQWWGESCGYINHKNKMVIKTAVLEAIHFPSAARLAASVAVNLAKIS